MRKSHSFFPPMILESVLLGEAQSPVVPRLQGGLHSVDRQLFQAHRAGQGKNPIII